MGRSQGSPPRVRGKVVDLRLHVGHAGITPACAGKSSPARIPPCRRRDHPRVCGEKLTQPSAGGWWLGSPPRVRGKEVFPYRVQHPGGITPACAGKRLKNVFIAPFFRTYPQKTFSLVPICQTSSQSAIARCICGQGRSKYLASVSNL